MASAGERWVGRYVQAWTTNDPDDIAALFTDDATIEFDARRIHGVKDIIADWLATRDAPGSWTFESRVLAETRDVAIIRGVTRYLVTGITYDNLWEVHLAGDGRASWFTEWYMERSR